MSIRLITTYEEAKALKEAGWPQTVMNASHYYDTNVEDDPCGPYQSGGRFMNNHPAYLAAPRLDELLEFLWERGSHFDIGNRENAYQPFFAITSAEDEVLDSFSEADLEPISVTVGAVLHVLNSERPTATDQST